MQEPASEKSRAHGGDRVALATLLLGGVCIGLSPIFARLADVGPFALGAYRMGFASLAMAALLAGGRGLPRALPGRRNLMLIALTGLLFAGDLACYFLGLARTSVAHATFIVNLAPVLTVLGGWLLFRERPKPGTLAGLVLALAGAALLARGATGTGVSTLAGNAFALAAAVFYAAYLLAVKQARVTVASDHLILGSSIVAVAALLPIAAATEAPLLPGSWQSLAALLALGLVGHAAGQGLIARALARLAVGLSSVVLLVQPTVAAVAAWLLFGETLGPEELAGAGLILAGITLAGRTR